MTYIVAPNKPAAKHLDEVIAEMQTLGAPTIKAYWDGEKYRALEGSHRIAAAHKLGLTPIIEEVEENDEMEHDIEDVQSNNVGDLLDYLGDSDAYYNFENL